MKRIIIGLTGASGSILAYTAVKKLLDNGHEVHFVASDLGQRVMAYELERSYSEILIEFGSYRNFVHHENDNMFASIASGSYSSDAMCIIPCSMGTLGKISGGIADNLLCRAADVMLKEHRPLVLVTRETPLSGIHLENMVKLSRYGATIMPPVPAFYNKPKSLEDMIQHTVARILRALGITLDEHVTWSGLEDSSHE
ncbi:MAG TPA: aromatic acid decarboxylase [Clostridiales bacterium UBA8960]|nr:aromatic acid decarboxylase [Clostridiales bacterium UBA8960]